MVGETSDAVAGLTSDAADTARARRLSAVSAPLVAECAAYLREQVVRSMQSSALEAAAAARRSVGANEVGVRGEEVPLLGPRQARDAEDDADDGGRGIRRRQA